MHSRIRTYAVAAVIAVAAPLLAAPATSVSAGAEPYYGNIVVTDRVIVPGRDVPVRGRLASGNRPVRLERQVGTRWRVLDRTRAARNGDFTLRGGRHLPACTWATLRVVAPRHRGHHGYVQRFEMPVVRQRATLVPTAWVRPGQKASFRGILVPQATRPVELQRRRGDRWVTVATERAQSGGEFHFGGTRVPDGAASFRITAQPYAGLPRVTSRPAPVRVHAAAPAPSVTVERLTPGSSAGGDDTAPQLSADGRYVVHTTHEPAPGTGSEIRLTDREAGTTTPVVSTSRWISSTTLSSDGRYVAFVSESRKSYKANLYLFDRVTGTTTLESPTKPLSFIRSADRILGKNARYLVYSTVVRQHHQDVMRDRVAGTTRALRSALPLAGVPRSQQEVLVDRAPDDPCDLNNAPDATLLDVRTGHEIDLAPPGQASENSDGDEFYVTNRVLSRNGRFAAYLFIDYYTYYVLVSDAVTGVTRELPVPASFYTRLSISADGSRIAMVSNEEADGRTETSTVVVTDWRSGQAWEVTPPQSLSIDDPLGHDLRPSLSADGSELAFDTDEALDPTDTNGTRDVYVAHLG